MKARVPLGATELRIPRGVKLTYVQWDPARGEHVFRMPDDPTLPERARGKELRFTDAQARRLFGLDLS